MGSTSMWRDMGFPVGLLLLELARLRNRQIGGQQGGALHGNAECRMFLVSCKLQWWDSRVQCNAIPELEVHIVTCKWVAASTVSRL